MQQVKNQFRIISKTGATVLTAFFVSFAQKRKLYVYFELILFREILKPQKSESCFFQMKLLLRFETIRQINYQNDFFKNKLKAK